MEARKPAEKLPTPRLQLRWEPYVGKPGYDWQCHYELVLPLGKYDIRREIWRDGEQVGERDELVLPVKEPSIRGSTCTPCLHDSGAVYADMPYRDGAHAIWDSRLLGNLPIIVIAPDGRFAEHKDDGRVQMGAPSHD